MSTSDILAVTSLFITTFATVLAYSMVPTPRRRAVTAALTTAFLVALVAIGVILHAEWRSWRWSEDYRQEIAKLIRDGDQYFWTFDELYLVMEERYPSRLDSLRPVLVEVLDNMVEDRTLQSPTEIWMHGAPPSPHDVRVYCEKCTF
jgi:hypothetical protein